MTCDEARASASLALDGELDELGSRQLRGHLASCRNYTREVGKIRLASKLLQKAPHAQGKLLRVTSGRIFDALINGSAVGTFSNINWIWPPIRSVIAGPLPLYGM